MIQNELVVFNCLRQCYTKPCYPRTHTNIERGGRFFKEYIKIVCLCMYTHAHNRSQIIRDKIGVKIEKTQLPVITHTHTHIFIQDRFIV